ncbi:MAG: hypothetical protein RMI94_10210 [Bryobacterales bacterium]|nr:hypothetical protein [Bryobacteraceae bacterium]MDW8130911.1 hypothetical protein [Bryobacterales bacterium]
MVRRLRLLVLLALPLARAQWPREEPEPRLPSGKSMREELLKADYEQSLRDAERLVKLSEEFKAELEKQGQHVLSVATLRKLEEIERLARRIRSRLRRF